MKYDGSRMVTLLDAAGIKGAVVGIMKVMDAPGHQVYFRISLPAEGDELAHDFQFPDTIVCGKPLNADWGEKLKPGFRTVWGVTSADTWEEAFEGVYLQAQEELLKLKKALQERDNYYRTQIFLCGINLDDEISLPLLSNLFTLGRAPTPDFVAHLDSGMKAAHHSLRDIDILELKFKTFDYPNSPTPGAGVAIYLGSRIRAGHPLDIPKDRIEYYLMKSDIELRFEEARRQIAPNAVSRLNCLYVTDDVELIRELFDPYTPILKVRISTISQVTKADIRWFDAYRKAKEQNDTPRCIECIENYWKGRPYDRSTGKWEFLVDGMIEVVDGLDELRAALDERGLLNYVFLESREKPA